VDATDQVVPLYATVGHEGTAMEASTVEDAVSLTVRPPHNDEIHSHNDGVGKTTGLEV
jgi:hypothetical protein